MANNLKTTVQNTSGVAQTFSFLGKHGVFLEDDEEFEFFGDIDQFLNNPRKYDGLQKAIMDGVIAVTVEDWEAESAVV